MTKIFLVLLCIASFFTCENKQLGSSNLDFSGMDEFWKVTAALKKNVEPSKKEWDALFNTPGYLALTQSEFTEEYFKKYFRLAYMSDKSDSLEKELKNTHWRTQYLNHMTRVLSKKEEIKNHQKKLLASNYLTTLALDLSKNYLPETVLMGGDLPPISFLIFGNDARGYSTMVIDVLYSIEQGDRLKYLVGHEAHHYYRNKMLTFKFPVESQPDYNLVWVLNQIQAEGIADQIDKRVRFFNGGDMINSKWASIYKEHLLNTPMLIRKMDSLLVQYATQSEKLNSTSEELRNIIPMSGHPTGYFMTQAIVENLGKGELINNVGNPFEFFRLYNQVASTHSEAYPMFSEKAMELINSLESKLTNLNSRNSDFN